MPEGKEMFVFKIDKEEKFMGQGEKGEKFLP